MRLESLRLDEFTDTDTMLFDDETKRLAKAAFTANYDQPVTKIHTLRQIEEEFRALKQDDLEAWQLDLEQQSQDYSAALKRESEALQAEKGRGSQVRVGRAIRHKLVPPLALRLEEWHNSAILQRAGRHHHLVRPILDNLTVDGSVDYHLVAHITVSCVLDCVGRGSAMSTPMVKVLQMIGERLDHQGFLEHIKQNYPQDWGRIDRWVLQQEEKGYKNKIKQAAVMSPVSWPFLDSDDCVKVGEWAFNCLQSITRWFDTIKWYSGKGKQRRFQYYLGLSVEGLKYRDMIQTAADEASYECWPMVCKPLRWENGLRGGYLKAHPGQTSRLIHNDKGSIPSKTAMAALHNAQEVGFKVNRFIYSTQVALLGRSEEIGSFRTYEKDSWEDTHRPIIDPAVWDLPRVNDGAHPEIQKAKRLLRTFHSAQKKAEKTTSRIPFRTLKVAARFLHVDRFFIPTYFDSRLRIYYATDTITPNGADYQKALLLFSDGVEVTDKNRDLVKYDLLVTIANTWANKENGVKTDKLSYLERAAFAEGFMKQLVHAEVPTEPLTTAARVLWTAASEPFQFLAAVREYYELFIAKTKTYTHLPCGRDATNSGMQILGSISRDEDACFYTNVIPSQVPQDLYGRVAEEALVFLHSETWTRSKTDKYLKEAKKKMETLIKEGKKFKMPDFTNFVLQAQARDAVDRSILKRAVMCTSYGASWQSKNEYISEELDSAFESNPFSPSLTDKRLITDASIEGQSQAFPRCDDLNDWFRKFGRACMGAGQEYVVWKTPNGSFVRQEYREPLVKAVVTHAMGGGSYPKTTTHAQEDGRTRYMVQVGWGDVKENKASTALGANWTHSLDGCLLQNTLADWDKPFFSVHDCFYGPAGTMNELTAKARREFHKVVTAVPMKILTLMNPVGVEPDKAGTADIQDCWMSPFMFT